MAKTQQKKTRKTGKLTILVYMTGFILLVTMLSFAAVLFVLGMLPSFVASYVDETEDRNHFRVVLACNFAGVLPFIMQVMKTGITSESVYSLLFTPHVWLVMYGAAAFGWALVWFFPQVVQAVLKWVQDGSASKLRERQQQIVDEWGLEVESSSRRALRNAVFKEENRRNQDETEEKGRK